MDHPETSAQTHSAAKGSSERCSASELRQIIASIKRKNEKEFLEQMKKMTPEEQEAALEWAKYMS